MFNYEVEFFLFFTGSWIFPILFYLLCAVLHLRASCLVIGYFLNVTVVGPSLDFCNRSSLLAFSFVSISLSCFTMIIWKAFFSLQLFNFLFFIHVLIVPLSSSLLSSLHLRPNKIFLRLHWALFICLSTEYLPFDVTDHCTSLLLFQPHQIPPSYLES